MPVLTLPQSRGGRTNVPLSLTTALKETSSKLTCRIELLKCRQLLRLKPGLLRRGLVRQCLLSKLDITRLRATAHPC